MQTVGGQSFQQLTSPDASTNASMNTPLLFARISMVTYSIHSIKVVHSTVA